MKQIVILFILKEAKNFIKKQSLIFPFKYILYNFRFKIRLRDYHEQFSVMKYNTYYPYIKLNAFLTGQNMLMKLISEIKKLENKSNLKYKMAKGGFLLGIGSGFENSLRLIRNIILARILAPEAFGLMAIILAVNNFFESFTQIGIKEAIIQNPESNERTFLNGAFWLAFTRGIILFLCALLLTPFITRFYNKPELIPMMRIAFLGILFNGIINPRLYVELKNLHYVKWIIIYHGGSALGIVSAIILSFYFHNIWALVIGYTVENAARAIGSYIVCPFFPKLAFRKEHIYSLARFVRGIIGVPILFFIYNKIDIFILAKYITDSQLGMYSLAVSIVEMPYLLFIRIIDPIILPVLSSMQQNETQFIDYFLQTSRYIALFFLTLLTIMASNSSVILSVIYGEKYTIVSRTFIILCFGLAIRLLGGNNQYIFFSNGETSINSHILIDTYHCYDSYNYSICRKIWYERCCIYYCLWG